MGPRLQDESMRAYDAGNIPGLRRPRTNDLRVARWVADCGPRATERLVRLIAVNPDAAGQAARCIRKQLADTTSNPDSTLHLLDHVMRACPYFYRYVANARFFATLWALHKAHGVSPASRLYVLLLVRAWAEDLAAMFFRRSDPPAAFWVEKYHRKRRTVAFPEVPAPPNDRPFVCKVSAGNKRGFPEPGHIMNREELEASLVLLDRLLAAAQDAKGWRAVADSAKKIADNVRLAVPSPDATGQYQGEFDESATLLLEKSKTAEGNARLKVKGLNEKVMAVLRRYDESFARFDPYLSAPHGAPRRSIQCPDVFGDCEEFPTMQASLSSASVGPSVAAVAREKARWKLSQTASSSTLTTAVEQLRLEDANKGTLEIEHPTQNSTDALSFPAVTPATFSKYSFPSSNEKDASTSKQSRDSKRKLCRQSTLVANASRLVESRTGT